MTKAKVRICIVDDHQIMIDGIRSLLLDDATIEIVGTALNAKAAIELIDKNDIDILISDINMPDVSGTELIKTIKHDHPEIKVLALTMHNDVNTITEVMQAGASGYLLKNTGKQELLAAIHKVYNNEQSYSPDVANALLGKYMKKEGTGGSSPVELTTREYEVLQLIVKEYSNKKIADTLFISERTVESHRKNLFEKTNSKSLVGLIKYAYTHKLI